MVERRHKVVDVLERVAVAVPETYLEGVARGLVSVLARPGERPLLGLKGELLIFEGQYLYHYADHDGEHYKLVSPAALRSAFSGEPVDSGWLSTGVVRVGENAQGKWAVMWVPPQVHPLRVMLPALPKRRRGRPRKGEAGQRALEVGPDEIVDLRVPLPGIVLAGLGREYRAWAVASPYFEPKAPVYYPPVPNIFPEGRVCWGENKAPVADGAAIGKAWQLFLDAPFNANLANGRSKTEAGDVRVKLVELWIQEAVEYPVFDLVPLHDYGGRPTVESLVKKFIAGKGGAEVTL